MHNINVCNVYILCIYEYIIILFICTSMHYMAYVKSKIRIRKDFA